MNYLSFVIGVIISILSSLALYHIFDLFTSYCYGTDVVKWSILFFVFFTITIYIIGRKTISHQNLNLFSGLIMMSMLFKILFSVIFVLSLKSIYSLNDPRHIVPFLLSYLVFTVFEVYFMSVMAKQRIYKK